MSVPAPCDILTQAAFDALAPSALSVPYGYNDLCTAIATWNSANSGNQIFAGSTLASRKAEIAAFVGHTLHESGDYAFQRELAYCNVAGNSQPATSVVDGGTLYCQPSGASGTYTDPYCSTSHTTSTSPDGCNCGGVSPTYSTNGYDPDKLFFGRGPVSSFPGAQRSSILSL